MIVIRVRPRFSAVALYRIGREVKRRRQSQHLVFMKWQHEPFHVFKKPCAIEGVEYHRMVFSEEIYVRWKADGVEHLVEVA